MERGDTKYRRRCDEILELVLIQNTRALTVHNNRKIALQRQPLGLLFEA